MMLDEIKARYPRLLSLIQTARMTLGAWSKRSTTISLRDYKSMRPEIGSGVPVEDHVVNLYMRAALEGAVNMVVEIGAMDGARMVTLKRLLPNIDVVAMDILKLYGESFESKGVSFIRFDPNVINKFPEKTLIVARGTLCCFNPNEVDSYFEARARDGHNLVVFEPAPLFQINVSASRGAGSWYHPWEALLKKHGFKSVRETNEAIKFAGMPAMMEAWYSTVAYAPSRTA